jgi:hypothetical protein
MIESLIQQALTQATGGAVLPRMTRFAVADGKICVGVRSSDFVPDGLTLAPFPRVSDALRTIDDYPTFEAIADVADPGLEGLSALRAWTGVFTALTDEIQKRAADAQELVDFEVKRMERDGPAAWHITGFDVYKQTLSLGGRTLQISGARRVGEMADLTTLFLGPLIAGEVGPQARRFVSVLHAERGGHIVEISVGRRQKRRLRVDLLQRKVV